MSLDDQVKGWLQSKTIWGAVIAGLSPFLISFFKLDFPEGFSDQLATQLSVLFGAGLAIYGRVKAVKKIG